ncbi:MAG TPA: aromatic ring-hydroxylating dioxygenase subunit alpha [Casimicrobiaceae bacterium]|nr:aromatic ring-hydroxylating dioxygenase subunit alpha [Casimicrobiaceae bacterium]
MTYAVDADVRVAATLDAAFYGDEAAYAATRERVFARTWQWVGDLQDVGAPGSFAPRELLPGLVDEPLLIARDAGGALRCLSNVCTHRGNILVHAPGTGTHIRCGYHSRRFDLAGRMTFMPEFQDARNFPSRDDDLAQIPIDSWAGHGFVALDPAAPIVDFVGDMATQVSAMSVAEFRRDPTRDREYRINAHWALYVENYLEGFHIPFVHPALAESVEYASYEDRLFPLSSLQIAFARPGEVAFARSSGIAFARPGEVAFAPEPDSERRVAALYWWIFPNLMLNFYPWGLSVNLVQPEGLDRTRVSFRSYVRDAALLDHGAGSNLDRVEAEDEAIVQAVQKGVRSRFYRRGRYSPKRERGVHHFHRLLARFLNRD